MAGLPLHGWTGLALVALFWPLNWLLPGARTEWCFFPLWLGYCLVVDGLAQRRRGTSLLQRSPRSYTALFAISVPLWWLFEAVNLRTRNWSYVGREQFSTLEYVLFASLSFSTVVPAVLGTAELVAGCGVLERWRAGPAACRGARTAAWLGSAGVVSLALLLAWPRYAYPLVWVSFYLLFEAANLLAGNRSLVDWVREGDWRPVGALALGVLVCGFFWELWNWRSYPKWVYSVPGFERPRLFEMPLAGYLGYVPFSFELFAAVHLVLGWFGRGRTDYVARGLAP